MKRQLLVNFTTEKEIELHEFLRRESFDTGMPMAEILRRGLEMYKNEKEMETMTKYLVKMVAGDENEFYNTENTNLPAPETIFETTDLEEARRVQKETEIIHLDETNESGETIFLAPVVIKVVDGEEIMLD